MNYILLFGGIFFLFSGNLVLVKPAPKEPYVLFYEMLFIGVSTIGGVMIGALVACVLGVF